MSDPKPMGKPYLATEMDYLKMYRIQTWEDGDPSGQDKSEYSEFQKPYAYDEDEPEDYPFWEFTWPGFEFPDIPPLTVPDPGGPPECSVDESCTWASISGPTEVDCGDSASYTHLHTWLGCSGAPWYAAFGGWSLTANGSGVTLIPGLVIARVDVSDSASATKFWITWTGYGCEATLEVDIGSCTCCNGMTIYGSDTVTQGNVWTGSIVPHCPGVSCDVSGTDCDGWECSVNGNGSQVSVATSGKCGGFTVTLTACEGEDGENTATKSVRISGGHWVQTDACSIPGVYCSVSSMQCYPNEITWVKDTGWACIDPYGEGGGGDCGDLCGFCCPACTCCGAHECYEGTNHWHVFTWKCEADQSCDP